VAPGRGLWPVLNRFAVLHRSPSVSACEPFQEAIDLGLSRGRNAMAIWQGLVSDYGFTSSRVQADRNHEPGRFGLSADGHAKGS